MGSTVAVVAGSRVKKEREQVEQFPIETGLSGPGRGYGRRPGGLLSPNPSSSLLISWGPRPALMMSSNTDPLSKWRFDASKWSVASSVFPSSSNLLDWNLCCTPTAKCALTYLTYKFVDSGSTQDLPTFGSSSSTLTQPRSLKSASRSDSTTSPSGVFHFDNTACAGPCSRF